MKRIAIIGSTGSIGAQTLSVIRKNFSDFRITALAAGSNFMGIGEQAQEFGVKTVCLHDCQSAEKLKIKSSGLTVLSGDDGLAEISAMDIDLLVVSGNGIATVVPVYIALSRNVKVALATKEAIVCGAHIMPEGSLDELVVPIDSEPSAIFQTLLGEDKLRIREILLTASGGPFFSKGATWSQLAQISPAEALNHPRWNMGKKVSIDSATLVNKGLELIEISRLFGIDPDRIRVMLHPQSIIHSGVVFIDGSTKFQASPPNMKYPISYALYHPTRSMNELPGIRFPMELTMDDVPKSIGRPIELARKAIKLGPAGQIAYASADEWAVKAFLAGELPFHLIPEVIAKNLNQVKDTADVSSVINTTKYYKQMYDSAGEIGRRLWRY